MKPNTFLPAFTLVELIVVVTIIAILGTVGFVSYSNYLTTARDSNRISQLTKIADALQVYTTRNSLPLPENSISITNGTTTIAHQGDLGDSVLQTIDYSTDAKDPKDNTPFTYFLSADRLNFQLLAFMEDDESLQASFIYPSQTYANLYQNRFPKTYGRRLGVLTDTDNTPLQNLSLTNSTLDISNTTLTLKSFLSNTEFLEGTGTAFADLSTLILQRGRLWVVEDNSFKFNGITRYPGCDTDDFIVGNYRVAACNVGATTAGIGSVNYGRFFQWGENVAWVVSSSENCTWDRDTQSCTTPSLSAWSSTVSDTTSGGANRWFDWGGMASPDTRGPCAPGYRVPSSTDWQNLVTAGEAIQTALQLPYVGLRNGSNGAWVNEGLFGYYWSSSPSGTNSHSLNFSSGSVSSASSFNRPSGFSVRCIKN